MFSIFGSLWRSARSCGGNKKARSSRAFLGKRGALDQWDRSKNVHVSGVITLALSLAAIGSVVNDERFARLAPSARSCAERV
jgi:hypothetical protein